MIYTVKIGKFLFKSDLDVRLLKIYAKTVEKIVAKGNRMLIVAGGGETARNYIRAARDAGLDEATCDQFGIELSRINAYLLISMLGPVAYPEVPTTIRELKKNFHDEKVVVMGGLTPGHSTTAVGAIAAEAVKAAKYIIASDVEGIYTEDPKKHGKALKLDEVSTEEVFRMASKSKLSAGTYALDPLAIKIIERSKTPTYFIDGQKPENLEKVILGEKIGTHIKPSV